VRKKVNLELVGGDFVLLRGDALHMVLSKKNYMTYFIME
jgi:hypothetical protein